MNKFPSPARMSSILSPFVVIMSIVFMFMLIYGLLMHEEYDEDDEVTITFNCTQVLSAKQNYPEFVIKQCELLRSER